MSQVTSLNYEKCSSHIGSMLESLDDVKGVTATWMAALGQAQDKSSGQRWMEDLLKTGDGITKSVGELSEALQDMRMGLKKYDDDLRGFAESRANLGDI